jgi:hypothetical protein
MEEIDAQAVWNQYYLDIKARRIAEAECLWAEMAAARVTNETVLVLDFLHISNVRKDADDLALQLSENYGIEVMPADLGYWHVRGTTRPDGIVLAEDQHLAWVEFMADVARSYACVFSSWALEAPSLGKKFDSQDCNA